MQSVTDALKKRLAAPQMVIHRASKPSSSFSPRGISERSVYLHRSLHLSILSNRIINNPPMPCPVHQLIAG